MPAAAPSETQIAVSTILVGKYRIVREIGRGGMAAVYEAEQLTLGKKVAIKVLASELAQSTIVIERFFREARAAAAVKSPHIVDVYDSGRIEDGRPFIAMELLIGESLYDRMARIRLIDPRTTVRIITDCARGLTKAHEANVVHRDLKPENIFITRSEESGEEVAKILDFGLAKFYAPVNPGEEKVKRLTREGAVFGTPAYMSPEQVKGQGNVDARADLWAIGCMAFECLTGRPVWNTDQGVAMTFAAIATGVLPQPSKLRPDLPVAFDRWFQRCLERDPDRRFQSAKELADALGEVWGNGPTSQSNSTRDPRSFAATELSSGGMLSQKALPPAPSSGGALFAGAGSAPQVLPGAAASGARVPPTSNASVPSHPFRAAASHPSAPFPLVQQGPPRPPTDAMKATPQPAPPPTSPLKLGGALLLFATTLTTAGLVYHHYLSIQLFPAVVVSRAVAPSASASAIAPADQDEPPWASVIVEGQKLFTAGDLAGAQKKLQEVQAPQTPAVGVAVAKAFLDQVSLAAATKEPPQPCRLAAFSHPRIPVPTSVNGPIAGSRPAISLAAKGAIVVWADSRDKPNRDHAWSVVIDANGRPITKPRDLTPDATSIARPQLAPARNDRTALLYWDSLGPNPGVRVRALDAEGRLDTTNAVGANVHVGGARPGAFWPTMDRSPLGFYVVWEDDRDKEGQDLFIRKLNEDLDTDGPETRLTDYAARPRLGPNVRFPSVTVVGTTVMIVYKLEKDGKGVIHRMKIPIADLKGLEETKDAAKKDRLLGDVQPISTPGPQASADAPAIACGSEACFIVWHETPTAMAALVDAKEGKVIWSRKIGDKASHPALGTSVERVPGEGRQVIVGYYEPAKGEKGARLKVSLLSREGIGPASAVARVNIQPNQPRPAIAPGATKGEWLLAWEDTEAGHAEPYAARIACR